jgi:Na+-driven multidrug efflux pump
VLFGVGALMVAFPDEAMRVFIADAEVIAAGVEFLRIIGPFLAFFGGLMVVQGGFRGAGDTRTAMALSILSRWLLRIPAALVLAYSWGVTVAGVPLAGWAWGVEGLWWAWSFSAIGSFVVGVAWFALGRWREGVVERGETPTPGD